MFTLLNALFAVSTIISAHSLVDNSLKPTTQFKKLLEVTNIKDGDLQFLVDQTQKKYLRKPGTERWDIDNADAKNHDAIRQALKDLDYLDEISPAQEEYDYIVLFGALAARIKQRLEYLIELLKDGIKTKKIIVLGSERPANKEFESAAKLSELFGREVSEDEKHTEYTIMKELVENSELKDMGIEIEYYSAPNHADGSRANTADTVELWMKSEPKAGSVLCISNQPYIWYQHEVARSLLPNTFEIESCGSKISESTNDGTILDSVARELYQFNKRINSKK